ncbi:MAG: glycosyltransferase family 39 protein [bacterium]|nr:glycosyltransferase family 39 protein [bacterium]
MLLRIRKLLVNKKVAITLIIILAAFLRLYRIGDYMTFLGDEGRDVLIVKGILEGHLTLLGPRASAADFFTGPIYYYFMAPFLWLFNLDPVGPAVGIALLGIITVYLVYRIGRYFFGKPAGLFAAALYAASPLVISYSRSSWNPNPMPFFSLLILFFLYRSIVAQSWKTLLFTGLLFGVAMQLHYIEIFLGLAIFLFILISTYMLEKKEKIKLIIIHYIEFLLGFIIGFLPFIAFEIRHGFSNFRTIFNFIFHQDLYIKEIVNTPPMQIIKDVFFRLFARLLTNYPPLDQPHSGTLVFTLWQLGVVMLAIASIIALLRIKNKIVLLLFSLWLVVGVACFGFYKKPIYDYYFEFMFPLPFLLVGNLFYQLYKNKKMRIYGKIISVSLFVTLFLYSLYWMPFRFPPNKQKDQVRGIAEFVVSKTDNKPFNFALIAGQNSDHAYRYFFNVWKKDPITIENEAVDSRRTTVMDQLLIVCEDMNCEPLGNPLWEIAGFGRAEIVGEWDVSVVKVFKLEPYREEE